MADEIIRDTIENSNLLSSFVLPNCSDVMACTRCDMNKSCKVENWELLTDSLDKSELDYNEELLYGLQERN